MCGRYCARTRPDRAEMKFAKLPFHLVAGLVAAIAFHGSGPVAVAAGATNVAKYEKKLEELINQYRVRNDLPVLATDSTLATLAREHSAAMAKENRLSHDELPSRVLRSRFAMCVENVGWNYRTPEGQFDGWRTSPGHNHNLLERRVERIGIGIVEHYVTQIACGK